jgi:hypothetical protein
MTGDQRKKSKRDTVREEIFQLAIQHFKDKRDALS